MAGAPSRSPFVAPAGEALRHPLPENRSGMLVQTSPPHTQPIHPVSVQRVCVAQSGEHPVISSCLHCWALLTRDPEVLGTVSGLDFALESKVVRGSYPVEVTGDGEMISCLADLNKRDIIRQVQPARDQLLSHVFLRKKPEGGSRLILNLKQLNSCITTQKFKLENLAKALEILRDGDFMAKIDLKDAYFSVSITEKRRKLLRFSVNGNLWEFQRLPNGLCIAPRQFTKLLKPVAAYLRSQGIQLVIYLDDLWLCAENKALTSHQVEIAVSLLESLGFLINRTKSVLEPSQSVKFLGFIIHSNPMSISLPKEKTEELVQLATRLLEKRRVTLR